MTKLYVKTTAFTILCLATVMAIIFFALSIFSPSTIANVAFNLGNKSLSIKYSEKQYEKTKSINDLDLLFYRCVWANDDEKIIIYANKLLNDSEIDNFSKVKGEGYINYVAVIYCNTLYKSNEKDKAVNTAIYYVDSEYKVPNPLSSVCYLAYKKQDVETLLKAYDLLDTKQQNDSIKNAKKEIQSKINEINQNKGEN